MMKLSLNMKTAAMAFAMVGSMMLYSCEEDTSVTPSNSGDQNLEAAVQTLTPKVLATIRLNNGNTAVFKTEVDGVVYEENGQAEPFRSTEELSVLERFLLVTDESVAVPEDLLAVEENEDLTGRAIARGTVDSHSVELTGKLSATSNAKEMASAWCTGHTYYDTDSNGQFYRTYKGYTWGISGATVYSSWKAGANACKTVNLYLVNCSNSNTLNATTAYKNVWGNYKNQDSINVGPSNSRFWSKTYLSKRYRRAFVSGFGSGNFGGYVLFRDY